MDKLEKLKADILSKLPSTNVEAFKLLIDYIDSKIESVKTVKELTKKSTKE